MRILTVKQPWAWAIIYAAKNVENRATNFTGGYEGPVLIHAGLSDAPEDDTTAGLFAAWRAWWAALRTPPAQRGHIIGVVDLVGVHHDRDCAGYYGNDHCTPWTMDDCFHYELANARALPRSIPTRGALGLRRVPEEVAADVRAQLAEAAA